MRDMDSEQLSRILDTQTEMQADIKQLFRAYEETAKDVMRLDRSYTTVNDSVIRLDEKLNGVREQNASHHRQQIENDAKQNEILAGVNASLTILMSAMGLDPKNETSIQEMRKDFFAIRDSRMNKRTYKDYFIRACITTLAGALLLTLYLGLQVQLQKGNHHDTQLGANQNGPQTTVPQLRNR